MLLKLAAFGSVFLALSFGIACTPSKDDGADGGSGRSGTDTDGSNGTGGSGGRPTGSGGSAGRDDTGGNNHAGATTDSGTSRHDGGTDAASTGGASTTDAGSIGGARTTDAGSTGGASTGGASTGDAGATGDNALTNPGFEDGVMSPWTSNSSNFIVGSDAPHSGSYNAKLYSGFGDPTWEETMSEEGLFLAAGTYTFHMWVAKAGTGILTTLRLEAESGGVTKTLDILQSVTGTYQEFTVSGITVASPNGPMLGACTVRAVAAGDDHVSVYLDDASLTKNP